MKERKRNIGPALIILAGCFWGSMGIFVRRLSTFGFSPIQIVSIRLTVAALVFALLLLLKDRSGFRIAWRDLPLFLGLGFGSILFFTVCYFSAITIMPLSTAAILLYTSPIWIMLMSVLFFREKLNRIVHPAVREYILETIRTQRAEGTRLFFLEAALLIEEKYNEICDELWYVYADEAVRRKRLKESRGYTDSKITSMIRSQLPEQRFREAADFVINNSGSLADSLRQVDSRLEELSGRV